MTIKNKDIKHAVTWIRSGLSYICNGATYVTKEKIAIKPEELTCKNCMNKLYGKRGILK